MADFCLECFNEQVLPAGECPRCEKDVTLTDEPELCEGCGEYKRVVVLDIPEPLFPKLFRKLYNLWERHKEKKEATSDLTDSNKEKSLIDLHERRDQLVKEYLQRNNGDVLLAIEELKKAYDELPVPVEAFEALAYLSARSFLEDNKE